MKLFIFLFSFLYSTLGTTMEVQPPSGEEVFDTLLSIGQLKLKNEPLCNATSTRNEKPTTFAHHLSTILSLSYYKETTTKVSSSCSLSKHQENKGSIQEMWDCQVQLEEKNQKGEFISSATIAFGLTKETHEYINGSLRCI